MNKPNHSRTVYLGQKLTEEMRGHKLNWSRIAQKAFLIAMYQQDLSPREQKAERLRLARKAVKDQIKRQGKKISHYRMDQITKAAKELIAQGWTP